MEQPSVGTREPLVVDFGEPVDHVSVGRFLQVARGEGEIVAGAWALDASEGAASWVPARPWRAPLEEYHLVVNGRFGDIAGNNINAAMDHRPGALRPGGEGRSHVQALTPCCPTTPACRTPA